MQSDSERTTRILLAKTAGEAATRLALVGLRREFPRATIELWTEEREYASFLGDADVARVMFYRSLSEYPALWLRLRREPPSLKVVLFTPEPTFAKVRLLALALPALSACAYDERGKRTRLGKEQLRASRLLGRNPDVGEGLSGYLRALLRLGGRFLTRTAQLILFPFLLLYLLLSAANVHARRAARSRFGSGVASRPPAGSRPTIDRQRPG